MKSTLPLALLSLFALSSPAHADRIWFGTEADAKKWSEGQPQVVEGKILEETTDSYVVRIEGGVVTIAKAMVLKVEKDALTVQDVEKRERDGAARLVQANKMRRERQAAEAAAEREAAQAAEASAQRAGQAEPRTVVEIQSPVPVAVPAGYDPVLRVLRPAAGPAALPLPALTLRDYERAARLRGEL